MNLRNKQLLIGIILLLAYVSIGVFGLLQMNHDESMVSAGDCLYALNSYAICDNGLSHINNWRVFSNFILPTILAISLLCFVIALFLDRHKFLRQKLRLSYGWTQYLDDKFSHIFRKKIIYWLSLFENSPPVSVVSI